MENLALDVRYALRLLVKRPAFTLIAVATLALGIGANTAIFSVVDGVLLRPLPYPRPDRLVSFRSQQSLPDLDDVRAQNQVFEYCGGVVIQAQDYTGGSEPIQVQAALVNSDLFGALGIQPALGRLITEAEDQYGGERVVVLSDKFYKRQFGGNPTVIGTAMLLSGLSYTIIGVMPSDFAMPREEVDLFASLRVVNPVAARERGVHFLRTYVRMKPGVNLAQAQADMAPIDQWLEQHFPEHNKGRHSRLIGLHERLVGDTRPALLILFGSVGLVLLIACANFANLLLTNATSRQQEMMIRHALGARRLRLVRQMLTESVLISLIGGAGGTVLAMWGIELLMNLKPANLPRLAAINIDAGVLAFTFVVAISTGIVFGLVPALGSSRVELSQALKEGGRTATGSSTRLKLRSALVVSEIALAVVLLIGAGLLIRGFWLLRSVDPGFNPNGLLTARIELPEARYKEIPKQNQFRRGLLERLNTQPGIQAAMISEVPLSGELLTHNFIIEGRPPILRGEEPELPVRSIAGDYFHTMGIPLLRGRDFGPEDKQDVPIVGLVNQAFVREYFPDEDPIGKRIRWARQSPPEWMTIVGVVGDIKQLQLSSAEEPAFYWSYMQQTQPWKRWMNVVIRGDADLGTLATLVKTAVWELDPQIPVTRTSSMNEVMATSIAEQRFNMLLMTIFAGVALLLSVIGVYGVISYSVAQRTHEIGIRMALGASTGDVLARVLGEGLVLTVIGVSLGIGGALALTRLMESMLFGVSATDPLTYTLISVVLVACALMACYVPARRAARVDPMNALRYE
jgi:putative ABC transport system permease protein